MPMIVRILATAFAVAALVSTYGGLMGRRAAVSMLVLMLSLKLLETFRIRDARVVASLSLFLCSTQFLFSQGVPMIFYIIACLLSSLIALMYLHRSEAYAVLGKAPETDRKLLTELGFGVGLMALALPIGMVFFLLFPRWGSPLWGLPEDALDARSGLSDSMSPGSIQSLFMDDSPAFRAEFEGGMPRNSDLYWRGPVFTNFDGNSWKVSYLSRTLAFAGQIFCDFAGYSTTAIGVALCLGFSLPDNFRFPYAAVGFSDFWRRWHISLSSWLRDYLYIPLGGNRKGNLRTYANLMTTMMLGGLWHGASWTFVVWGALHGSFLAAERWLAKRFGGGTFWKRWGPRVLLALITYFLVNITWVFFRAPDFATAWRMIDTMLTFNMDGKKVLPMIDVLQVTGVTVAMLAIHWFMRNRYLHDVAAALPRWLLAGTWGLMLWLIIITQGQSSAFIYFQF